MTTLVHTRRALETLSMGNAPERQQSKRLAGAVEFEKDDDFQFVRKSKRGKTKEAEPVKTSATGRPPKADRAPAPIPEDDDFAHTTRGKSTRRKAAAEPSHDESQTQSRGGTKRRRTHVAEDEHPEEPASTNGTKKARKGKNARRVDKDLESPPVTEETGQASKITLPMSDTPIINRNKEMRKKGTGNRRSSLGSRGRRASSLIDSGQTALPHREVKPSEFYKHIEAEGLPEPRRMKQLLTWCGERALSEKPAHGTKNSSVIHGARAIQDQLLKDFGNRSEFSDWFSREDGPKAPVVLKPNPRNAELDEKISQLEANIKRLQEEKQSWQAIRKPPPEQPPLFSDAELQSGEITLPDFDLLDEDDGKIRTYLDEPASSFESARSRTEKRLQAVRSALEYEMDQLADNVHKLEQRVSVAGEEAQKVLNFSQVRLREREMREREVAGTKDLPLQEILRSLGSMLPEGGG